MKKEDKKEKKNTLAIIGICIGWLIPLAGVILGIASLNRKERSKELGIIAIAISVVFWIGYFLVIMQ